MGKEGTCTLGPKADHMVIRREQGRGVSGRAETPKRTAGELGSSGTQRAGEAGRLVKAQTMEVKVRTQVLT